MTSDQFGRMRGPVVHGMRGPMSDVRPLSLLTEQEQDRMLPDFECEHGRLPGDRTPACGCFPRGTALEGQLLEHARGLVPATDNQSTRRFDHEEAVRLYLDGWPGTAIAFKFGVAKQSVYAVLGKAGVR